MKGRRLSALMFVLLIVLPVAKVFAQGGEGVIVLIKNASYSVAVSSSQQPIIKDYPAHGTVQQPFQELSGGMYEVKYTPNTDYIGADQFTLELSNMNPYNGNPGSPTYITFKFNIVASIVSAKDDYAVTGLAQPVSVDVTSNDYASHPPLTLKSVVFSEGGSTVRSGGTIHFVPSPNYSGLAQIRYTVCDSLGTCDVGELHVSVMEMAPGEISEVFATTRNTPLTMPLYRNDFAVLTPPGHGQAYVNDGQELYYVPNANFVGTDTLRLISSDQATVEEAIIHVYNKADPNQSAMDDLVYTSKATPVTFNVSDNDVGNFTIKGFSQPYYGTLEYNGSGEFTYTPDPQYQGTQHFSYTVGDMYNPSIETADVTIVISDQQPVLPDFTLTTTKDSPLLIEYPGKLPDFSFSLVTEPLFGGVAIHNGVQTVFINGEVVTGNNLVVYYPPPDFIGTDEFDLRYCMNANGNCYETKVHVEVVDGPPASCYQACVWPGDANNDGIVSVKDLLDVGLYFGMTGPARADQGIDWYGHDAQDWEVPYTAMELKYVDADGDGQITAADTSAIATSYGQYRTLTPYIPTAKKQINISFGAPSNPNPQPGDFVSIPLILGTDDMPAVDVYGFTFNVNYWVDAFDNAYIKYDEESWFTRNDAVLTISKNPFNGRIETAMTRTGSTSISGMGIVGTLNFIIDDQIDGIKGVSPEIELSIDGGQVTDGAGQYYLVDGSSTKLTINLAGTGLATIDPGQVIVYPNPTSEDINIHLNGGFKATEVQILDMAGRRMYGIKGLDTNHITIPVSDLASGMYLAKVTTVDGVVNKKFNVAKRF